MLPGLFVFGVVGWRRRRSDIGADWFFVSNVAACRRCRHLIEERQLPGSSYSGSRPFDRTNKTEKRVDKMRRALNRNFPKVSGKPADRFVWKLEY